MGADSSGASTLGKWDVDENAVLGFAYTTSDDQEAR